MGNHRVELNAAIWYRLEFDSIESCLNLRSSFYLVNYILQAQFLRVYKIPACLDFIFLLPAY